MHYDANKLNSYIYRKVAMQIVFLPPIIVTFLFVLQKYTYQKENFTFFSTV